MSELLSARCNRLYQILSGRVANKRDRYPLAEWEALLDALFVLYDECTSESLMKDKHVSAFAKRYKSMIDDLRVLRVKKSDFEIKKTIGKGHFGEVHVVREKVSGNVYAMKVLKKTETLAQDNIAFFEEEKDIMAFSNNPWITSLQYAFQDQNSLYLVMEFQPGGDLLCLMNKFGFDEDMARFYLAEISMGLHAMHNMGYVHRDIKPENVLIDRTGHIKLADFGSSAKLSSNKTVQSKMAVGTPEYISPEVLSSMDGGQGKYGIECDWWSVGVVAYEMLVGSTPFEADTVLMLYSLIMDYKRSLKFPDDVTISDDAKSMITGLLTDRQSRLTFEDLANHSFFKGIDWTTLKDAVPPHVPTITSMDDTSNFDEFEPEKPLSRYELGDKKKDIGFSGKNLPFVGFTFTRPLFQAYLQDSANRSSATEGLTNQVSSGAKDQRVLEQSLANAQSELDEQKKRVEEHKRVVEDRERTIRDLEKERSIMEQKIALHDLEVKDLRRELETEKSTRERAEVESSRLSSELKGHSKRNDEAKEQQLSTLLEEQKLLLNVANQEKAAATKRSQQLEAELKAAHDSLEESKVRTSELQAKVYRITEDTREGFTSIQLQLAKVTSDCDLRVSEYQQKVEEAQLRADGLARQLRTAEDYTAELQLRLSEAGELLHGSSGGNEVEILKRTELELRASLTDTGGKLAAAEKVVMTLEHDLETKSEELRMLEKSSMKAQAESSSRLQELEKEISTLRRENKKMKTNLIEMEAREAALKSKRQEVEEKLSALERAKLEKETEMGGRVESEINRLRKENTTLEDTVKDLEAELGDLKEALELSRRRLDEAEDEIELVTDQYEGKIREFVKELEKVCNQVKALQNELVISKQKNANLEIAIAGSQAQVMVESGLLEEKNKVLKETEKRLEDAFKQLEEAKADKRALESQLREENRELTELQQVKRKSEEQLREKARYIENLELTITMLKRSSSALEGQVEELETMADQYAEREKQSEATRAQLNERVSTLERELEQYHSDTETQRTMRLVYEEKTAAVQSSLDNLRTAYTQEVGLLNTQLSEQSSKVKELTAQVSEAERAQALTKVSLKSLERRLENEADEKSRLAAELERLTNLVTTQRNSNFALSQELESVKDRCQELSVDKENLLNEKQGMMFSHDTEKIKLEQTLAQQSKLIDFLQQMTETSKGKKKLKAATPVSQTDGINTLNRRQRDLEQALEKEKTSTLRLHLELKKAREEISMMKAEYSQARATKKVSADLTPGTISPAVSITDLTCSSKGPSKPARSLPHRFLQSTNIHGSRCTLCFNTIPCGATLFKCSDCSTVCHEQCSQVSLGTCVPTKDTDSNHLRPGVLRSSYSLQDSNSSDSASQSSKISGWLKIPLKFGGQKQSWEKRYISYDEGKMTYFDSESSTEPLEITDLSPCKVIVHGAVPSSQILNLAPCDSLLAFSIELDSSSNQSKQLYFLALSLEDKAKWVPFLEAQFQTPSTHVDNNLLGTQVLHLDTSSYYDLTCSHPLDELCLLGSSTGLLGLSLTASGSDRLVRLASIGPVHQIKYIESLGLVLMVVGVQLELCSIKLFSVRESFRLAALSGKTLEQNLVVVCGIKGCHTFAAEDVGMDSFLCAASLGKISIMRASPSSPIFNPILEVPTDSPCCCVAVSSHGTVVFGTSKYYRFHVSNGNCQELLDRQDTSLAFAVFAGSQSNNYPLAVFPVQSADSALEPEQFLLCFNDFGMIVNGLGRRCRSGHLHWGRLPLAFDYREPYLYITHVDSIQVREIPSASMDGIELCTFQFVEVRSPRTLGPAVYGSGVYLSITSEDRRTADVFSFQGAALDLKSLTTVTHAAESSDLSTRSSSLASSPLVSKNDSQTSTSRIQLRQNPAEVKVNDKQQYRLSSFRNFFKNKRHSGQFD